MKSDSGFCQIFFSAMLKRGRPLFRNYERLRLFKINATVGNGEIASYAMKREKLKENVAKKNKEGGQNNEGCPTHRH